MPIMSYDCAFNYINELPKLELWEKFSQKSSKLERHHVSQLSPIVSHLYTHWKKSVFSNLCPDLSRAKAPNAQRQKVIVCLSLLYI